MFTAIKNFSECNRFCKTVENVQGIKETEEKRKSFYFNSLGVFFLVTHRHNYLR